MFIIGVVATLVTLVAVLIGAGHAGYLGMLSSAAKKRPGGQPAVDFAKKRMPSAGIGLGIGLLALLFSLGEGGTDIVAILLAGGGGFYSLKQLQSTQAKFRNGQF
ncbi:hypothetical protein [Saccharopolyspora cebuensis]|uniref:Uncharacterized protein n=1 Tax=Saccharopolyspora cebuensis TaxID=418759 RepID=A0ABV4CF05_9PSEU